MLNVYYYQNAAKFGLALSSTAILPMTYETCLWVFDAIKNVSMFLHCTAGGCKLIVFSRK